MVSGPGLPYPGTASSPSTSTIADLDGLFQLPAGSRIADFWKMQLHLYRHDITMQDYFEPLQLDSLRISRLNSRKPPLSDRLIRCGLTGGRKLAHLHAPRKFKTDILFCPTPYFGRQTEIRLLVRTLLGLAQTDAKILCLLRADAPCRAEIDNLLASQGRRGQVEFIDPATSFNSIEERLLWRLARMRGNMALEEAVQILEPFGLHPSEEVKPHFERAAHFVEGWERLAPSVEFGILVCRCHWYPFCSPVCRTARQRGKPVITFQQGVIGHTLDVPVSATKYVAFGPSSAAFLGRVNDRFSQESGMPQPAVEYIDGGSFLDTLRPLPNQFDRRTLLMVDLPCEPCNFYGIEKQCCALLQLAEQVLNADLPLQRLVIRPHPYWSNLDIETCQQLIRRYSDRCELSHPAWPLEDDLRRSSVVVGILSGVLTVASACGLPTIFLGTEQGFTTGDLACFSPSQTLLPEPAFCEIAKLLSNRALYTEARSQAIQNAREYYAGGTNSDLDGRFFERLLRSHTGVSPRN